MIAVEGGNKEEHKGQTRPEVTELVYMRNREKIRGSLRAGVGHVLRRGEICFETKGRMQCEINHRSVVANGEMT